MPTPADAGSEEEEEESSPEPKPWGWEFRVTLPGGASQPDAPDEPEAAAATEPPTPPASPTPPTPPSPPSPAAAETEPSPPPTPPQHRRPAARSRCSDARRVPTPRRPGPPPVTGFQLQLGTRAHQRRARVPRGGRRRLGEPEPAEAAPRAGEPAPAAEPPSDRPWWAIGAERRLAGWCAPAPRAGEPGHRRASSGRRSSRSAIGLCLELDPPPQPPKAAAPPPTLEASKRWTCAPSSRCCASAGWARPAASRRPTSCNEQRRRCMLPNVRP